MVEEVWKEGGTRLQVYPWQLHKLSYAYESDTARFPTFLPGSRTEAQKQ